jgi:predicted DNA-binding transcriptional regulator AlpA
MLYKLNNQGEPAEGIAPRAGSSRCNSRRNFGGPTSTRVLPRLMIAEEVASLLRKSSKTIYKWAAVRLLPSINLNGNILFDQEEILAWIEQHRMSIAA